MNQRVKDTGLGKHTNLYNVSVLALEYENINAKIFLLESSSPDYKSRTYMSRM